MNSIFEGNYGPAIVVDGGMQVRIEGNVMESNRGPAVIAGGSTALTVHSNYYEANNLEYAWPMQWAQLNWDAKGRNVSGATVCSDLLLNGAPYRFGQVQGQAHLMLSTLAPCEGVTYTSNFHGPMAGGCQNYAAVHAVAVSGLSISGNGAYAHCGTNVSAPGIINSSDPHNAQIFLRGLPCKPAQKGAIPPIALLSTGSNASRYWVRGVTFFANTAGFDLMNLNAGPIAYQGVVHGFGRWIALRSEVDEPGSGGGEAALHTFHSPDVLSVNFGATSYPPHWTALPSRLAKPSITRQTRRYNGRPTFVWSWNSSTEVSAVILELPLEDNPVLAGEAVYVALQVRSPNTSVALAIDPGDGGFLKPHCSPVPTSPTADDSKCWHTQPQGRLAPGTSAGWQLRSFQATLGWEGTARFAMHALSIAEGATVEIEIAAPVVVGLVGAGWSSLSGQFEPPPSTDSAAALKTDDERPTSAAGSVFYAMTDACEVHDITNPTAPLEPCIHPHALCPGIMHGVQVGTGDYNVTVCNNTAWTYRSLWHNSSAVLTATGFAQTVSNVHLPNTSNAHEAVWPPLEPVAPSCPVIPRVPCPPAKPGAPQGSCSGFLGTGHGGEYVFSVTLHGPDGSTVDLLRASPEQKKRWAAADGSRISIIKQSQIGAYLATQNVTLDPVAGMTVTANFTLGFDHVNSGNHSVNWFYPCMSMFALPFKRWVAHLTNGTELSGVFSSTDEMTLQKDIEWIAVYDDDSRRGAVYQYQVGRAPLELQKGLASNEIWNRKYDHKLYLQLAVPTTKGAQFGVQHTVTAFTAKSTEPWLDAAKKLVHWPAVSPTIDRARQKSDDVQAALSTAEAAPKTATIRIETDNLLRKWDGIGGLSAGASSRLLFDYPDGPRSDILDLLFTPRLGWGYQILKMELGGDCQSTWGTESSYAHSPTDIGWGRGYEWWLAKEAKQRNPNIALASLSWCVPGWVQGGFISSADVKYHVDYVKGAKLHHNLTLDYVGVFNERESTPEYIIELRAALDAAGFETTKLVASDLGNFGIYNHMAANKTLEAAVDVIGTHHMHSAQHPADATGGYATPPGALQLPPSHRDPNRKHRALWSSEDGLPGIDNAQPNWDGAKTYAVFLFSNLRLKGQTATILCPAINAWMPNVGETLHGFIWAHEPHSGHYSVGAGLWVGAHWTHHTERGWWYVGGGSFAHGGRAPPSPPPPSPPAPSPRTCAFKRLHTNGYCANDHHAPTINQGLDEKDCAAACTKLPSCSAFEFGCSGNKVCILLPTCEGPVRKSGCGTNVDVLINSTACPLLPPPPPTDMAEEWDLNGSWVALTPGLAGTPTTVTIIAETVNALRPQTVHIVLPHTTAAAAAAGSALNVFLTCLNESCTGFPRKLHSREQPVTVGPDGALSMVLQPAAVYTFTTLEPGPQLPRPLPPPKRSLWSASNGSLDGFIFKSSFGHQQPQEPGRGIANFFGNFEVSATNTLRQTSLQPCWPWRADRADGYPQAIFGTNLHNYAVSTAIFMPAGFGRVCGRVGEFHGGFEHMTAWPAPPGVCLNVHVNGSWTVGGYSGTHHAAIPNLTLSSGSVNPAAVKSVWTVIEIRFEDYRVSALIGSEQVVAMLPLQPYMLGSATGVAAIGSSWDAVQFDNVTILPTRPIVQQAAHTTSETFLHELLLLDYTPVSPPAGATHVGFALTVHAMDLEVTALGRFQTQGTANGTARNLSIVDASTGKVVAGCTTSGDSADLLGFVNCELTSPQHPTLRAGQKYYVVSQEATAATPGQADSGYYSVSRPAWSVSSGYKSLIDYNRDAATVVGSVTKFDDARGWMESLVEDTMTVALNLHVVA